MDFLQCPRYHFNLVNFLFYCLIVFCLNLAQLDLIRNHVGVKFIKSIKFPSASIGIRTPKPLARS